MSTKGPVKGTRMELTAEQLRILRHMLGIDDPWQAEPKPTRDYYCANHGDTELRELQRIGAVHMYRRDSYEWFATTAAGRAAALVSHKTIRYSKAKRIYGLWLNIRDVCQDTTFRDFLTRPEFAETRKAA